MKTQINKNAAILVKIFETGKIILGYYDVAMIGYQTEDGFYNLGDAMPV